MRVVIADDSALIREGLARLLAESGVEVCETVANGTDLVAAVDRHRPDVAIIDIRMPPTYTHEGAVAAIELRERMPALGVLLLSQAVETHFASQLLKRHAERFGYLLKDRVVDVETLMGALRTISAGGTALDPEIVRHLMRADSASDPLAALTERERDVLALMAEGRSNSAIADRLTVSLKTVESHIANIFSKLGLHGAQNDHRRVLAVLTALKGPSRESQAPQPEPPIPPTGRVLATMLMTDVVESTKHAVTRGDKEWTALLERHRVVVRQQLKQHGGREIVTTGDGFLATFNAPAQAVLCAMLIEQRSRALGVEIRGGVHTGEIELMQGDVGGIAVHICARLSALAGSGEVLVSSTVRDLVTGSGIEFDDRGSHELKGVPDEWRVFAVRS